MAERKIAKAYCAECHVQFTKLEMRTWSTSTATSRYNSKGEYSGRTERQKVVWLCQECYVKVRREYYKNVFFWILIIIFSFIAILALQGR